MSFILALELHITAETQQDAHKQALQVFKVLAQQPDVLSIQSVKMDPYVR